MDPGHIHAADELRPKATNPQELAQGRRIYEANCAICHGVRGDGRGMAAHMFVMQPRDFTKGMFEFRSTPSGSLPTDSDLIRTITQGLRGTPMVAQRQLTQGQLRAVIAYIKTFSERFSKEIPAPALAIPDAPSRTTDLLAEGKNIYQEAGCDSCHGSKGLGDGPSAGDLKDDRGYSIRPSDLTRPLKRGSTARSIYQTLITGLDGTPMPSYHGALTEEQLWALAFYIASLNTGSPSFQQRREETLGQHVLMMRSGSRSCLTAGSNRACSPEHSHEERQLRRSTFSDQNSTFVQGDRICNLVVGNEIGIIIGYDGSVHEQFETVR